MTWHPRSSFGSTQHVSARGVLMADIEARLRPFGCTAVHGSAVAWVRSCFEISGWGGGKARSRRIAPVDRQFELSADCAIAAGLELSGALGRRPARRGRHGESACVSTPSTVNVFLRQSRKIGRTLTCGYCHRRMARPQFLLNSRLTRQLRSRSPQWSTSTPNGRTSRPGGATRSKVRAR